MTNIDEDDLYPEDWDLDKEDLDEDYLLWSASHDMTPEDWENYLKLHSES